MEAMVASMSKGKTTVMIVDDSLDILDVLSKTLTGDGYRVVACNDPRDAVERLEIENPAVLISDLDMPGLNGHAVLAAGLERCPRAARILITGTGTLHNAARAINENKVHKYIQKPFTPSAIRTAVREVLDQRKELERASLALTRSRHRTEMLEELESQHPGVTLTPADSVLVLCERAALADVCALGLEDVLC
jgi:DNA-binding NtrC family response regulator